MAKDKILKPFVGIIAPENKFTVDTIDDLKSRDYLTIGDIVDLNGYYTAGDGAHHKRKIESADDGSGVQLANGLWANIVHNGEINVSWFGSISEECVLFCKKENAILNLENITIKEEISLCNIKGNEVRLEAKIRFENLETLNIENIKFNTSAEVDFYDSYIRIKNCEKVSISNVFSRNLKENRKGVLFLFEGNKDVVVANVTGYHFKNVLRSQTKNHSFKVENINANNCDSCVVSLVDNQNEIFIAKKVELNNELILEPSDNKYPGCNVVAGGADVVNFVESCFGKNAAERDFYFQSKGGCSFLNNFKTDSTFKAIGHIEGLSKDEPLANFPAENIDIQNVLAKDYVFYSAKKINLSNLSLTDATSIWGSFIPYTFEEINISNCTLEATRLLTFAKTLNDVDYSKGKIYDVTKVNFNNVDLTTERNILLNFYGKPSNLDENYKVIIDIKRCSLATNLLFYGELGIKADVMLKECTIKNPKLELSDEQAKWVNVTFSNCVFEFETIENWNSFVTSTLKSNVVLKKIKATVAENSSFLAEFSFDKNKKVSNFDIEVADYSETEVDKRVYVFPTLNKIYSCFSSDKFRNVLVDYKGEHKQLSTSYDIVSNINGTCEYLFFSPLDISLGEIRYRTIDYCETIQK